MGSVDTVDIASDLIVRPYVAEEIPHARKDHPVVSLTSLLSGVSLDYAVQTERFTRLDAEAAERALLTAPTPYMDPLLRKSQAMSELLRTLEDRGLIVWRTSCRGTVGYFTVAKKNDKLRIIFDC